VDFSFAQGAGYAEDHSFSVFAAHADGDQGGAISDGAQGFWLALFKSLMLYDLNRFDRISSHGFDGLGEVAVAGTA
jgi:hypothetical protein